MIDSAEAVLRKISKLIDATISRKETLIPSRIAADLAESFDPDRLATDEIAKAARAGLQEMVEQHLADRFDRRPSDGHALLEHAKRLRAWQKKQRFRLIQTKKNPHDKCGLLKDESCSRDSKQPNIHRRSV